MAPIHWQGDSRRVMPHINKYEYALSVICRLSCYILGLCTSHGQLQNYSQIKQTQCTTKGFTLTHSTYSYELIEAN